MPSYVLFVNLTDHGRKTVRDNPNRIKEVNAEMKAMGVTIKGPVRRLRSIRLH